MEWPLHEPPQKVGDYVFFDITQSPSPRFWPPVPFVIVLFFNLIISPLLYPCHNPVCPLCFYSGSTMDSQEGVWGGGVLAVSLAVRAHVLTEVASWCTLKITVWCSALKIPSSCFFVFCFFLVCLFDFLLIGNHYSHLSLGLIIVWINQVL